MRWRFVDRVASLEPWQRIEGSKAVSLEEYSLPEPLGREGAFPETLVIECCVELARWFVVVSSSFTLSAVLCEIEGFRFIRPAETGAVLRIEAGMTAKSDAAVSVACEVLGQAGVVAGGRLVLCLLPLESESEREDMAGRWRELHGAA